MAAAINTIGVYSGILTIASFFGAGLPGGSSPQGAMVQIKAGLGDPGSVDFGGTVDRVYAYDANNAYLGQSDSCRTAYNGDACDVTVNQAKPDVQAEYISIANGNDATCISWVSVKQNDRSDSGGAWTGDIVNYCSEKYGLGLRTYPGNQRAGTIKDTGDEWKPFCAWFDGDGTDNIKYASFKFRVGAYGSIESQDTLDRDIACDATIYGPDTGPIPGTPAKRAADASSAAMPDRLPWMKTTVVNSTFSGHSAEEVCSMRYTWGPDFIGSDGKLCDLETHTLYPLCSVDNVEGCAVTAHGDDLRTMRTLGSGQVLKTYNTMEVWD